MSITLPVLYIDGRPTSLLQPQVATGSGNTFFAKSKKSVKFGDKVPASALPNGLNSKFTVGSVDNTGIAIPTHSNDDRDGVIGQVEVEVNGKTMLAYVSLRDKGNGAFNLVARVTNKREAKVLTEDEIFTSV